MTELHTLEEVKKLVSNRDGAWGFIVFGVGGLTWSYATTSAFTDISTIGTVGSIVFGVLIVLGLAGLFLTRPREV